MNGGALVHDEGKRAESSGRTRSVQRAESAAVVAASHSELASRWRWRTRLECWRCDAAPAQRAQVGAQPAWQQVMQHVQREDQIGRAGVAAAAHGT